MDSSFCKDCKEKKISLRLHFIKIEKTKEEKGNAEYI